MKKITQLQWVIQQLNKGGQITRNEALRNYISRLSGYILKLKRAGWEFEEGKFEDGDYIYRTKHSPYKKTIYHIEGREDLITYNK